MQICQEEGHVKIQLVVPNDFAPGDSLVVEHHGEGWIHLLEANDHTALVRPMLFLLSFSHVARLFRLKPQSRHLPCLTGVSRARTSFF